jgi:plastocyanin
MRWTLTLAGAALVALILSVSCNSSSSTPTTPTTPVAAADVTITITGMNGASSFSPNPGTVKVGQTVAWRNSDSTSHTATSDTGAFNTGNIAPGRTSTPILMSTAGSLNYHCSIHPSMVGTLNVQ